MQLALLISASVNVIVHCVTDLTLYDQLFSMEFLNSHANIHGTNFPHIYYNLLTDLYQNYTDLYEYNSQLHAEYEELMDFFSSQFRIEYLMTHLASNDFADNIQLSEDFGSTLVTFNDVRSTFIDTYNNYLNAITTVHDSIQNIQTMNPNFRVPFPPFNPIRVTPIQWIILDATTDNLVLDPIIFQYDAFNERSIELLNNVAAAVNSQPLVTVNNIITSYNLARQTLSRVPFNIFSPSNSINLFEIETEQRRSRARTRRAVRNLPSDIVPTRSPSRSPSRSDTGSD